MTSTVNGTRKNSGLPQSSPQASRPAPSAAMGGVNTSTVLITNTRKASGWRAANPFRKRRPGHSSAAPKTTGMAISAK